MRELISTLKKKKEIKKTRAGKEHANFLPQSSQARKKPPRHHLFDVAEGDDALYSANQIVPFRQLCQRWELTKLAVGGLGIGEMGTGKLECPP